MSQSKSGLRPASAWLVIIGVWLLLQLVIGLLASLSPSAVSDIVMLGACELLVLGAFIILLSARPGASDEPSGPDAGAFDLATLAIGRAPMLLLLASAIIGVAINPVAEWLRGGVELVWPTPEVQTNAKMELLRHDTVGRIVALFAVIGLLGPIVEELFYRGVLFTRVQRSAGVTWAAGVTCVGFAFTHADVRDWPALLVVGGALTWLRYATGSVWSSIAAHVAFNATTLSLLILEPALGDPAVVIAVGAVVSIGLLVWLGRIRRAGP